MLILSWACQIIDNKPELGWERQPRQERSLLGCPIVRITELTSWWRLVTKVVPILFQQVSSWGQWAEAHEDGRAQFSHSGTDVMESVQLEKGKEAGRCG